MEHFWDTVDTIGEGFGFSLFGARHLVTLALYIGFAALSCKLYKEADGKKRAQLRGLFAVLLLADEAFKQIGLQIGGNFNWDYLPLHLCSINISLDGARQIWTDVELSSIEDFKGVALRVPDVPIYVDSFDALGFITTIVPWGDCYTAVQTGVVSGLEIDYNSFADAGMDRIMPYCMITNHSVATNSFAIHDSVLEKLSEEQKAVLFECIDEATDYINNLYFEKLNETVEAIKANGVTFTEATAEQSAEMSSIVKPVVEDYLINNCQFTADEMDAFFAELAK